VSAHSRPEDANVADATSGGFYPDGIAMWTCDERAINIATASHVWRQTTNFDVVDRSTWSPCDGDRGVIPFGCGADDAARYYDSAPPCEGDTSSRIIEDDIVQKLMPTPPGMQTLRFGPQRPWPLTLHQASPESAMQRRNSNSSSGCCPLSPALEKTGRRRRARRYQTRLIGLISEAAQLPRRQFWPLTGRLLPA
jgi:hypothetical protein